ncbi:hypothetical protein GCM10025865_18600 [Paraoerskovia sediminicola]|uniref:Thioredoxin domain-containing protein n=1 Tax=Paraoerskovia sediminicola TaxID=1138587 RepID=A0ABM8G353_9CELL|nr:thioredoxin family protein [Paraoerskovia sediminicola]BDZ42561.1 hypothetical protein GCM10025865_18600 [Paraoerskovia sediminicola]
MTARVLVLVAVVVLTLALGAWWRSRQGAVRRVPGAAGSAAGGAQDAAHSGAAGAFGGGDSSAAPWRDAGVRIDGPTFVQLSSEICTACRSTARVLRGIVEDRPALRHVELDVAEHPGLVRELGVLRTPTVLVVSAGGHVVARTSGATNRRQALDALAALPAREHAAADLGGPTGVRHPDHTESPERR